jgi:hypothetical protein
MTHVPHRTTRRELELFLALTVGEERSAEAIRHAMRSLGILEESLDRRQVEMVLDFVATAPGIVGVAARFARSRLVKGDEPPSPPTRTALPHSEPPPPSRSDATSEARVRRGEITALLAPSLGIAKATDLVDAAAARLEIGEEMPAARGLDLLEALATEPGLAGVAARFAMARLILRVRDRG